MPNTDALPDTRSPDRRSRNNRRSGMGAVGATKYGLAFLFGLCTAFSLSSFRASFGADFLRVDELASAPVKAALDASRSLSDKNLQSELDQVTKALSEEQTKTNALKKQIEDMKKGDAVSADLVGHDSLGDGPCSHFPNPVPSAVSLWSSHLGAVFNSTQHPVDTNYDFHDFTALLLHFMTPDRLARSAKTLPRDWETVERIASIIHRRLSYLKQGGDGDDPKAPRKLNILTMGGSVTMGVLCNNQPVFSKLGAYSRRACAWPGRLASFINNVLGGYDVVHSHTMALGGTNTESGITMWQYSLFPSDTPYPDILINGYATNDVHVGSMKEAEERNQTLEHRVFDLSQRFIRAVLTPHDECRETPLLIYLDDYVGNEQHEILATTAISQSMNLLSTYYGISFVSYADAIRDIVYGDTRENWFSPHLWFQGGKGGNEYQRQIHPGMGMHISAVWVVAFNLLNIATTYCSLPPISSDLAGGIAANEGKWDYGYRAVNGLPVLKATKELEGGPKPKPRGLPPLLTDSLSLEHVTQKWVEESKTFPAFSEEKCDVSASTRKPCIFTWVGGLERKFSEPDHLNERMKSVIKENGGWESTKDNGKLGFVPINGLNSRFTMEWKDLKQPVRVVNFMIMRSYGEKWQDSKVSISAFARETPLAQMDIIGFHGKQTSETNNIKLDLRKDGKGEGAMVGDTLKVVVALVGGTTFKITGMAVCEH